MTKQGPKSYPSRWTLASVGLTLAIIATIAGFLAPSGPTVKAIAAAGLRGPENDPAAPARAALLGEFGSIGARTDTIDGHKTSTLIYARGRARVYATTVDGEPLDLPGSKRIEAGRLKLAPDHDGDVSIVAWHDRGKTYVLSSRSLDIDALAALLRRA